MQKDKTVMPAKLLTLKRLWNLLISSMLLLTLLWFASPWLEKELFLVAAKSGIMPNKVYLWGRSVYEGKGYSLRAYEYVLSKLSDVGKDVALLDELWQVEKTQILKSLQDKKYRQARRWFSRSRHENKLNATIAKAFADYETKNFSEVSDQYIQTELLWERDASKLNIIKGYVKHWNKPFFGDWRQRNERETSSEDDDRIYLYLKLSNRLINSAIRCNLHIKAEEDVKLSKKVGTGVGLISSVFVTPIGGYLTSDLANKTYDYFGGKAANNKWSDKSISSIVNIEARANRTTRYNGFVEVDSEKFTKTPKVSTIECLPIKR